jgi:pilus assembly protein CpaB
MKRRIIAVVAALLLSCVGAVGLYSYVQAADQRAMAGQKTAKVLVVTKAIPTGTPSEQLTGSVTIKLLPSTAIAPDAVGSLSQVGGLIATTDLQPGEQVLSTRFVDPATLTNAQFTPVPKGLQEISLQLDAQRALGGNLVPGDTVGVVLTISAKDQTHQTHLTEHNVLVSRVQGGLAPVMPTGQDAEKPAPLPTESVMVTLAVNAQQAEKIIFAAEAGKVWLSHEPTNATRTGTSVLTEGSLFQ